MPIAQRLTPEQRLNKTLPKGWRSALRHPLIQKLCYGGAFNPTPANISQAIKLTKSWKGASWAEKVFVLALDIIMEKGLGVSVLDPDTYNRLNEHLANNDNKMQAANWRIWHTWCWDIYHDGYGLLDLEEGELDLPRPRRIVKKKLVKARKRKRKVAN